MLSFFIVRAETFLVSSLRNVTSNDFYEKNLFQLCVRLGMAVAFELPTLTFQDSKLILEHVVWISKDKIENHVTEWRTDSEGSSLCQVHKTWKITNKNVANLSLFGEIDNTDMISVQMKFGPQCRKYLRDGHQVILAWDGLNVMTGNTSVQLIIYCSGKKRRGVILISWGEGPCRLNWCFKNVTTRRTGKV